MKNHYIFIEDYMANDFCSLKRAQLYFVRSLIAHSFSKKTNYCTSVLHSKCGCREDHTPSNVETECVGIHLNCYFSPKEIQHKPILKKEMIDHW